MLDLDVQTSQEDHARQGKRRSLRTMQICRRRFPHDPGHFGPSPVRTSSGLPVVKSAGASTFDREVVNHAWTQV